MCSLVTKPLSPMPRSPFRTMILKHFYTFPCSKTWLIINKTSGRNFKNACPCEFCTAGLWSYWWLTDTWACWIRIRVWTAAVLDPFFYVCMFLYSFPPTLQWHASQVHANLYSLYEQFQLDLDEVHIEMHHRLVKRSLKTSDTPVSLDSDHV